MCGQNDLKERLIQNDSTCFYENASEEKLEKQRRWLIGMCCYGDFTEDLVIEISKIIFGDRFRQIGFGKYLVESRWGNIYFLGNAAHLELDKNKPIDLDRIMKLVKLKYKKGKHHNLYRYMCTHNGL